MTLLSAPRHLGRYRDIGRLLLKYGRSDLVRQAGLDTALVDDVEPAGAQRRGRGARRRPRAAGPDVHQARPAAVDPRRPAAAALPRGAGPPAGRRSSRSASTRCAARRGRARRAPVARLRRLRRDTDRGGEPRSGPRGDAAARRRAPASSRCSGPASAGRSSTTSRCSRTSPSRVEAHSEQGRLFAVDRPASRSSGARCSTSSTTARKPRTSSGCAADRRRTPAAGRARAVRRLLHRPRAHDGAHPRPQGHRASRRSRDSRSTAPALARALFDAYLDQILVEGFFHADPHPGNVLLTPDGRLGLIDVGMVARVTPEMREHLMRLLHGRRRAARRGGRPARDGHVRADRQLRRRGTSPPTSPTWSSVTRPHPSSSSTPAGWSSTSPAPAPRPV